MRAMGEEVDDQQLQDLINEVDADGMTFCVVAFLSFSIYCHTPSRTF